MALAVGVSTAQGYTSGNSTTTSGITTQSSTNIFVFVHSEGGTGVPTITDSNSNTYTLEVTNNFGNGVGTYNDVMHAYTCLGASGGSGHTVTASKSNGYATVYVVEITGTSVAVEDKNDNNNALDTLDSGNVTTAGAAILVGGHAAGETSGTTNTTWNNSFTKIEEITSGSFWQGSIGTRTVTAGTYSANITETARAGEHGLCVLAFYENIVGGVSIPVIMNSYRQRRV